MENKSIFDKTALCALLRDATNEELNEAIAYVQMEQNSRRDRRKIELLNNIRSAIQKAVTGGFEISISTMDDAEEPDCVIHANNWVFTVITLEEDN